MDIDEKDFSSSNLAWTGERYLPSISGSIEIEHLHRYLFACELVSNKKVLDIACGEGYGSYFLASMAAQVYGVDNCEKTIGFAKNKYQKSNLLFQRGSCANIPLLDHSIDVAVSFETIEHHTEHELMMSELRRVLVPDGLLILSSPDKYEYSDVTDYKNPFHFKELYKSELEDLLRKYFNNYQLLGQRLVLGSHIANLPNAPLHVPLTYFEKNPYDKSQGINKPVYFIALASDSILPTVNNSIFEGGEGTLKEKNDLLARLSVENHDKTLHLIELQSLLQEKEQLLATQETIITQLSDHLLAVEKLLALSASLVGV